MGDKNNYIEQLKLFYNKKLSTHSLIQIGETPLKLQQIGVNKLPIIMTQSNLRKCVREAKGSKSAHNLPKNNIEKLPEYLSDPVFAVKDGNKIALIVNDQDQRGNHILVALQLDSKQFGKDCNEVKSIYGRENLRFYLETHINNKDLLIVDQHKANVIYKSIGIQAPAESKLIKQSKEKSDSVEQINKKLIQMVKREGFGPSEMIINNLKLIHQVAGRMVTLKEIHAIAKNKFEGVTKEEKCYMKNVIKDCQRQELLRLNQKNHVPDR